MPTIQLDYRDGDPAWCLRMVQPERFKEVDYKLIVRTFLMPKGGLIGVLLKLFDDPDQPYFVHRVMDLADPNVVKHVEACADAGKIVAVFEPVGQSPGFSRPLELDGGEWGRCLQEGLDHNKAVGADGDIALDSFLNIFRPVSETRGVEEAWEELDKKYPPKKVR